VIVLDTNVLSEMLRPQPDPGVMDWIDSITHSMIVTTSVTRAELMYGIEIMPSGKRRDLLRCLAHDVFEIDLRGRLLGFDRDAADAYAVIGSIRRSMGQPVGHADTMIASIVHSRGAVLATRNIRDFVGCGVSVVNPCGH
jgi:predicted nucleic acid-binding protein